MRRTVEKRLYRQAIKEQPDGSKLRYRKDGSKFWIGARRLYQDLKRGAWWVARSKEIQRRLAPKPTFNSIRRVFGKGVA